MPCARPLTKDENLCGKVEPFVSSALREPFHPYTFLYINWTPNNDGALKSRQQLLKILKDCVVGQGTIFELHCLLLLTSSRVTFRTFHMCVMRL